MNLNMTPVRLYRCQVCKNRQKNNRRDDPVQKGTVRLIFFIYHTPLFSVTKGITDMSYTKKTTENLKLLAALSDERNGITPDMYTEHAVFRGLRDMSGNGVVTGLTEISTIKAKEKAPDGSVHPCPGQLYYRGYNICDLVGGFSSENRFGFEETAYLLLFSSLPDKKELQRFEKSLPNFAACLNPL